MISWFSRKQSYVALSIAKEEYVVACSARCEEVCLRKILSYLFDLQLDATCIYCDNQSSVKLSKKRCWMTSRSISRSSITISGIWCKEEQ